MPSRRVLLRLGLPVAFGLSVAGSALFAASRSWPSGTLPGLTLDGQAVPPHLAGEELEAYVAQRIEALRARRVRLVLAGSGKAVGEVALGELGLRVDEGRTRERLAKLGHEGDLLTRAELARKARRGELDVPLLPTVDMPSLAARLRPIKEKEDRDPANARLDLDQRTVVPERPGVLIEPLGASAAVLAAARAPVGGAGGAGSAQATVELPVFATEPRVKAAELQGLDVSKVLATYETFFSRRDDQAARSRNIEVAASRLDGLVLSPGEIFSFNGLVGDRSEDSGFEKSWEILKGEMTEGVGGGTCQVASTFHAAAFFAGLEIPLRLPHSRPSAYIPMGLDATVVFPSVDLKVRNPFSFPVVVHTSVIGNRIKVDLLGAAKPVRIRFAREVVETLAYRRKVVEKPELHGTEVVLRQHGIRGYRILRKRIFTYRNGRQREEVTTNLYPATAEIYEVPPGFDPSLLPPLPFAPAEEDAAATDGAVAAYGNGGAAAAAAAPPQPVAVQPSVLPPTMLMPWVPGVAPTGAAVPVAVEGAPAAPVGTAVSAADCVGADCRVSAAGGPSFADVKRELSAKGFKVTEAKGTHAPTQAQANPTRELEIKR